MNRNVTLKSLAGQLDLSISTVSKALNDCPEISEETTRRVKEIAALNKYYPNSFAKGLKSKKTKMLGVIVPAILPNFFSMVLDGIEEKATELGYKVTIHITKESLEKEKQAIEMLIKTNADGILISPSKETHATNNFEHLKLAQEYGISLVMFDRIIEALDADKVSIDDQLETELATLDLIKAGRRKIAYISGIAKTSVNENRKLGYLKTVEEHRLTSRIIEVDTTDFPNDFILDLIADNKIDALVTSDELSTILTARHVITSGYRIPEDIALMGFTNGKMLETFIPSISSIDQKAKEQGEIAVQTAIDRIEGLLPAEFLEFTLKANIIHRESTEMPVSESLYAV